MAGYEDHLVPLELGGHAGVSTAILCEHPEARQVVRAAIAVDRSRHDQRAAAVTTVEPLRRSSPLQ